MKKLLFLLIAVSLLTVQAHPPFVTTLPENPELETLFVNMDAAGVSISIKKR